MSSKMRQYLAEGIQGAQPFLVDRSRPFVVESRSDGSVCRTKIPGRFSVCDEVNGNRRRYRKAVWEKNMASGSPLQEAISKNAAFGLLEHPKDGAIDLLSPISHQVTSASLRESRDANGQPVWEVVGEISIYDTEEGRKLKALIEGGYNPPVSSRGFGTLVTASDGIDDVQDDYVCESWDVVIKPSCATAELVPAREPIAPTSSARMAEPVRTESVVTESKAATDLKEAPSKNTGAAGAASSSTKPSIMELSEIKQRISGLKSLDVSKLEPSRISESQLEIETLHNEVAKFAATEPTRAYEGQRLHTQLDEVSNRLAESVAAPRRAASKLQEHNTKLMRVVNAVAQQALNGRKHLGEALGKIQKLESISSEVTRRGQGWRKIAESRRVELETLAKKHKVACEALDEIARRYHADTTDLGRRLIQVEFREALASKPEVNKSLREATRLRHVAAIREKLEGKPKEGEAPGKEALKIGKSKGAASSDSAKVAETPGKVACESKPEFSSDVLGGPRKIDESVQMVRRLSGAAK